MMAKSLPIIVIVVLSGLLAWLVFVWEPVAEPDPGHAQLEPRSRPVGGDFELTSVDGPLSLADLRGKVVLLYFGYTACPDICPTNLAIIALALRELTPDELAHTAVLFVSVDPERDTPARTADYARYFHPAIIGLTGSDEAVAAAAAQYGAAYSRTPQPDSAMGYVVDHSAATYVIDPAGALVEVLDHATPAEQIRATLRRYLAAGSDR